jgi:hypothetical protein
MGRAEPFDLLTISPINRYIVNNIAVFFLPRCTYNNDASNITRAVFFPELLSTQEGAMPRRRTPKGKPMNVEGVELRAVRLELDAPTHRALRIEAAKADKSLASYVRDLVEEHLKRKSSGSKGGD